MKGYYKLGERVVTQKETKNLKESAKVRINQKNEYFRRVFTEDNDNQDQTDIEKVMKKFQFTFKNNFSKSNLKKTTNKLGMSQSIEKKSKHILTVKSSKDIVSSKINVGSIIIGSKKSLKKISKQKALLTQINQHNQALKKTKKVKQRQPHLRESGSEQKKNRKQTMNKKSDKKEKKEDKKNQQDLSKCHFELIEVVGTGTFGVVYKAKVVETKQFVAIKKVLQDKKYKNRELQILQNLNHPNVLYMKHAFFTKGQHVLHIHQDQEYLNVIMDYYPETIFSMNKNYIKSRQLIPNIYIKLYSYQYFRALAYIHALGICHRDIKPHNILVDPKLNKIVICDFGSAKKLSKQEPNIAYICSRCYRAPQLIFGSTTYTSIIDMWSIGCVIIEMINGQPIFLGQSNADQLVEIIKVLGTPSRDQVFKMNPDYDIKDYKFPNIKLKQWKKVYIYEQVLRVKTDPLLVDLISKIMLFSPEDRLHPIEALLHPYYDCLRDQTKYKQLKNKLAMPNLFDFSKQELSYSKSKFLTPPWWK